MFTLNPLFEAEEHLRQLRAEAANERLQPAPIRHLLAEALRRSADWLDSAPVVVPLTTTHP